MYGVCVDSEKLYTTGGGANRNNLGTLVRISMHDSPLSAAVELAPPIISLALSCCTARTMMSQNARVMSLAAAKARSRDFLGRNLALPLLGGEKNTGGNSRNRRTIAMASTAKEYLLLEDK